MAGKGFEIAQGYLDIEADTDGAFKDVKSFFKEVDGELAAEEKAFAKSGEESGRKFSTGLMDKFRALNPFKQLMEDGDREVRAGSRSISSRFLDLFRSVGRGRGKGLLSALIPGGSGGGAGRLFSGLMSSASKFFSTFASGFADAISTGAQQAGQAFKSISSVFSQIGSVAGGIGGVLPIAAFSLLIPLALGLAGALLQLSAALLLIPGAIGVLLAAVAPLVIALKGFGEAVGAGLSGDVDKFNEALKGLAPNARKVAKEIVGLKPLFKGLKTSVQDAFFGPLVGQLSKLGTALIPTLGKGLTTVAGALGRIVAGLAGLLSTPRAVQGINDLFAATARILDRLGPTLIQLFDGIGHLVQASLPWVERLFGAMSDGIASLAGWLTQISSDGKLNGWLERAWDTGKKLWAVLRGLGEFAVTLLGSFGDEGTDTLNGMADAIAKVNLYLKSKEGQETLHNLGVMVHWAGNAFVALIAATVGAYKALNAVFAFVRGIGPFFKELGHDIADMGRAVGRWAADLWGSVSGAVASAWSAIAGFFSDVGSAVGGWFSSLWSSIVSGGGAVLAWLGALPGRIGSFIMGIPGMISTAAQRIYDSFFYMVGYAGGLLYKFFVTDVPGWARDGWNWVVSYIQESIARSVANLQAFPGQVWAFMSQVGSAIMTSISSAWDWAVNYARESIARSVANLRALPGQAWGALSSIGSAIGGQISAAWDWAKRATSDGFNAVMGWIRGIPGAVKNALSGAGSWLYGAGRDVLHGLANGIADTLSWAVDMARRAAQKIKDGFLGALGISSPSKVMRMEVGRWILPGVVKGMQDTQPSFERYLGATANMITGGFSPTVNVAAPNVSVGGTTLVADLGEGIRQAVPLYIAKNPDAVASANAVGSRTRDGWVNTGRTTTR